MLRQAETCNGPIKRGVTDGHALQGSSGPRAEAVVFILANGATRPEISLWRANTALP
jgi:hypothetical protein